MSVKESMIGAFEKYAIPATIVGAIVTMVAAGVHEHAIKDQNQPSDTTSEQSANGDSALETAGKTIIARPKSLGL